VCTYTPEHSCLCVATQLNIQKKEKKGREKIKYYDEVRINNMDTTAEHLRKQVMQIYYTVQE
jgi:hypothetical protein